MPPTHNANGVPLVSARSSRRPTYQVDREYVRLREEHEKRRAAEVGEEPVRATTLSKPFGTKTKAYRGKAGRNRLR
jgi:hypothetical protein